MAPLPWQDTRWRQLLNALQENRLSHALLVSGSAGIGKQHFCCALAALLLCHNRTGDAACGYCKSCELLRAGTHSDMRWVGAEQGSRQIKIDQIRRFIEFVSRTAALGEYKVVLVKPAEAMNPNAANALLKTLEEPADNTCLLLIADDVSRLLPTLRSRCQPLPLADPPKAQSLHWLRQVCGESRLAEELLEAAAGKPLHAREIFIAEELGSIRSQRKDLDALLSGAISPLDFPRLVADQDLAKVLGQFCARLEQNIRQRVEGGGRNLTKQFQLLDYLQEERRAVAAGANPNRQLCIEARAMQLIQLMGDSQGQC